MTLNRVSLDQGKLICELEAGGALENNPYAPIFCVVAAGLCDTLAAFQAPSGEVGQSFDVPENRNGRGLVATIGDDPGVSRGIAAFDKPSIEKLLAKCDLVVLQVAAFQPPVMEHIAALAARGKTICVIETLQFHETEWYDLIMAHNKGKFIFVANRSEGHA